MADKSTLSQCLCWDDGCLMWLFNRRIMLELYVGMKSVLGVVIVVTVVIRANRMAFSSNLSMWCNSESLYVIRRLLVGLYTPNLVMLSMPCSFGGMNEPFMYIHCCE